VQVTDVKFRRLNPKGKMKALASITIDGEFVVHDLRIIEGRNGLFVAFPSRRTPEGEYRDICYPITRECRKNIEAFVLGAYEADHQGEVG